MGWVVAIGLFVASLIVKNTLMMVAAGLFAIAGSISLTFAQKKPEQTENNKE